MEESSLPFPVDLFIWDELPESFRKRIEAEHVVLVEKEEQSVRDGWEIVPLGELTDNFDAARVPVKRADRRPGPYPYYGASGIVDSVSDYLFDGEYLLIAEDGENLRTRNTPIAFLANGKFWVNNHAHIVRGNHKANTRYLMYALSELDVSGYLTGSTMPKMTQGNMNRISLLTPPISEQRAIAHILGTLDDKIELNRRMNETLEGMARALFKSWFVDFDPVRAKMEGRDTGLPPDVDALFPDRLVDSELGEIPEGWEVGCLADIAVAPRRGVDPTSLDDETPYIGLEHMPCHSIALTQWEGAGKVTSSKSVFKKGEFLFGKLRPYFHKVGVTPVSGICSTDVIVVAPKASQWSSFVLTSISSDDFVAYANQTSTGTRMPRTSWKTMSEYRVCLPLAHAVQAFQDAVQPMIDGIVANVHGSHTLAALSDTLLPKLISGEIRTNGEENI